MNVFKDKIAIITGGASGIGRELGRQLALRGAVVILADLDENLVQKTVKEISGQSGKATPCRLDVTDREAVQRCVNETVEEYGKLDYIFNNAGIGIAGEVQDFSYKDWKSVIDVNFFGVVHGVCAAYPVMLEQGFGHIVNTASMAGLIPIPGEISYVASKYGVVGLSHALRTEAAAFGVKVSVVCPGVTDTPILKTNKVIKHDRKKMLSSLPPPISPEQLVRAVLSGIEKNKRTIIAPASMKAAWLFYRLFPGVVFIYATMLLKKLHEARKE